MTNSTIQLQPKTTALVLIDLQQGIVGMETAPYSSDLVIQNSLQLIRAFHDKSGLVIFVRVSSSPDGADMLSPIADEPMVRRGQMPPDWDKLSPALKPGMADIIITKHQWGAFYGTELDLQLRRRNITTIVLGGIATNFGVESTARDAYERGYRLLFAEDAMSARSQSDHEFAVTRIFPRIGRVRKTKEIISAL
jgi:nicotinamidase-related amidase